MRLCCTESTRGGAIGGRGRGRGAGATAPKPVAADFLIGSKTDHSLSQPTESSQSRKRNKISPEKSKLDTVGSGFCSEQESDGDDVQSDPRKDENWKIQRRKGFTKDKEDKIKQAKIVKLSKTKKRNSTEPQIPPKQGEDMWLVGFIL